MDGVSIWIGIVPLVAVLFAWGLSEAAQRRRQKIQKLEEKRKIAIALKCEVEIIRKKIETSPPEVFGKLPDLIHENYFAVFDSNTAVIGQFDEAEKILSFYGNIKAHLDSLRTYSALHLLWQTNMNNGSLGTQVQTTHENLVRRRGPLLVEAAGVKTYLKSLSGEGV